MGFPTDGVPNQGWKLYLTSLVMVLSAGLVVITRIVTRYRVVSHLEADDLAIVLALVSQEAGIHGNVPQLFTDISQAFSVLISVMIQLAVVHGYGKHKRDLSTDDLQACLQFFWIAQIPYKIVVCLNKVSVILLYLRIFISPNFRWVCYAALAIVVASGIATTFATIFQCFPIEKSWNKNLHGTCIDSPKFWLANAVLNVSTDVLVLALPIREVFKLQLKLQERIMLCSVFLLGGL